MSGNERETMNDNGKEFESPIEYSASETRHKALPWKKAISRVLAGMALDVIVLNFWRLNYILPAVGIVLQLLGFRTLRHENKWFAGCFAVSIIRTAYFFTLLILNTTILQSNIYAARTASAAAIVNMALLFIEFLCLWRAFISVRQKARLQPHAGGAAALILWYVLMCLLALIRYNGSVIAAAMAVGYVFIIFSLYKLSKEIDEAGYDIHAVPIKVTDRRIVISLVALLVAGFALGYTFGSRYPMKWTALDAAEHEDVEDIKSHLLSLGFPKNVLNDIRAEDIAACDGALRVVVDAADKPVNDGRTVITQYESGGVHHTVHDAFYDAKELRVTGIGVQIPGEKERWIIFHHFLWTADPGFCGTEAIRLLPVYCDISAGWYSAGDATGRVLYDREGETFASDYYFIGSQTYASNSVFGENQSNTGLFAAFSMPRGGEKQRGYVAYPIGEVQDGYIISSWFNYTHQKSCFQYPAMTAMEKSMENGWNGEGAFKTVQDALQFRATDAGVEMMS